MSHGRTLACAACNAVLMKWGVERGRERGGRGKGEGSNKHAMLDVILLRHLLLEMNILKAVFTSVLLVSVVS